MVAAMREVLMLRDVMWSPPPIGFPRAQLVAGSVYSIPDEQAAQLIEGGYAQANVIAANCPVELFVTDAAVEANRFVKAGAMDLVAAQITSAADTVIGVSAGADGGGGHVSVQLLGPLVKLMGGETVALGELVNVHANGRVYVRHDDDIHGICVTGGTADNLDGAFVLLAPQFVVNPTLLIQVANAVKAGNRLSPDADGKAALDAEGRFFALEAGAIDDVVAVVYDNEP